MSAQTFRVAVDIGGTFVDAMELCNETGVVRFQKAPTTPLHPWQGVLTALELLGTDLGQAELFIHGTTLGLNAVLERRGQDTGVISNEGFRDIFLLGRGNVPDSHMYDFQYERPRSLVRRRHTVGVKCRLNYRGEVVEDLDLESLRAAATYLVEEQKVTSIAVCYLHSFLNPQHEQESARLIREWFPQATVSISSDIVREYREYERTSTTVLEAYIRPIFERYVGELERGLQERGFAGQFLIMRSGGGSMTSAVAKRSPTHTVLSGPAGGIVGGSYLAEKLNRSHVLTVDIGGTSLDACVIESGSAVITHLTELEHFPILMPSYDIRTIGAGGGSLAWIDRGLLKVGPESAGAMPGPVCYGRGGKRPTVTDASVALGYVSPASFMNGEMHLYKEEALAAIEEHIAEPLGMSVQEASAGIFDVMLAKTVGAVRQITVERGHDPRDFTLLAFGGAGPLIAPLLGQEMGVREVIVPFAPSGFSAWGMLSADVVHDTSRTVMQVLDEVDLSVVERHLGDLVTQARTSLEEQSVSSAAMVIERHLDLRYLGQEHTLSVRVGDTLSPVEITEAFNAAHRTRYGHAMDNRIQVLTARVRGIGRTTKPTLGEIAAGDGDPGQALLEHRDAFDFGTRSMKPFAVYRRDLLQAQDAFDGPALIDEGTSTTIVHSGQTVIVDAHGYLIVTAGTRANGDQS